MSINVSPPFAGFVSHVVDGTRQPASLELLSQMAVPAGAPHDALSMRLQHMGMVVAITALDRHAPMTAWEGAAGSMGIDGIHFQVAGHAIQRLGLPDDPARESARPTACEDPVVESLSRALERAERGEDEYGSICADALRLAIATRLLMARAPSGDIQVREPEPAAPKTKTGLPKWRLKRVEAYIEAHLDGAVTLADMALAAGLSRMHFASQFRIATGMPPREYLLRCRIERAQRMLLETGEPVVEIALAVGFQTQAHFTTVFRRFVGDTPCRWRCANRCCH
ncbi:AraC family transcriptional regulator [Xanthobacter sp. VTT E-85241]|uniref:helix-turn-helix domain-containing protein n=1 Tax=Roseixanthobacter finlandensis TaxID=3119922 RepID=UPI00268405A1|nr:AraC family transcriptional regulator [Xanthobacteraceae bacterium]